VTLDLVAARRLRSGLTVLVLPAGHKRAVRRTVQVVAG
jgi:hypothetical protein